MSIRVLPSSGSVSLLLLASAGLVWAWTVERDSVERANRLHRAGDLSAAAGMYAERIEAAPADHRVRYNLGTTLLKAGVSTAAAELEAGSEAPEADLRSRSHYNLGLWNLRRAAHAESVDSAWAYALASAESSKQALRMSPGRPGARWNLAMAQRMLDSIRTSEGLAGTETVRGSADADELVPVDEGSGLGDDSRMGEAPVEGDDETPAPSDEIRALTTLEADEILGSGHPDATPMLRKLLSFEGRAQRGARFGRTTPRW